MLITGAVVLASVVAIGRISAQQPSQIAIDYPQDGSVLNDRAEW
jgi:hypothetical protein